LRFMERILSRCWRESGLEKPHRAKKKELGSLIFFREKEVEKGSCREFSRRGFAAEFWNHPGVAKKKKKKNKNKKKKKTKKGGGRKSERRGIVEGITREREKEKASPNSSEMTEKHRGAEGGRKSALSWGEESLKKKKKFVAASEKRERQIVQKATSGRETQRGGA